MNKLATIFKFTIFAFFVSLFIKNTYSGEKTDSITKSLAQYLATQTAKVNKYHKQNQASS